MWSCLVRDHFGYGEVPASSANVESDFNNIKTVFLEKKVGLTNLIKSVKNRRKSLWTTPYYAYASDFPTNQYLPVQSEQKQLQ